MVQKRSDLFPGDRVKLASNVAFPPTEEALEAITKFGSGSLNFVQFVINPTDEVVEHSTSHQGRWKHLHKIYQKEKYSQFGQFVSG